ncbi:MAG: 3'-5' exonuclease [Deltaproteobacteria bacterium]|nr:3'-5' exonuclease [Deltaproteobacteria bacterium]
MGDYSVVVLDFETTGLSPDNGDRAIEIGAVLVSNNRIMDRFQSLMNPGKRISLFIQDYTGITNAMLKKAPPINEVMHEFWNFMAGHPLVAHNANFDRKFLDAELQRIGKRRTREFACSMLASRRIYPDAPGHNLQALVRYTDITTDGTFHRALADAEMTARLWIGMINELKTVHHLRQVPFDLMRRLSKVSKAAAPAYLARIAERP